MKKKYIYVADPLGADRQILAQHEIDDDATPDPIANKYFYLHDRLGSVRLLIDDQGAVKNMYTYDPFGEMFAAECSETTENPFKFTGQWFDAEIEEYYLRLILGGSREMRAICLRVMGGRIFLVFCRGCL